MQHRIMVHRETESKNEIAWFGLLKPPIPAISNASVSEKQTPTQSLRTLFTDDQVMLNQVGIVLPDIYPSKCVQRSGRHAIPRAVRISIDYQFASLFASLEGPLVKKDRKSVV